MSDEPTTITEAEEAPAPVEAPEAVAEATEPVADAPVAEASSDEAPAATENGPVRPGAIVEGTVVRLVDFGAFVDVVSGGTTVTGLVHVSEIDAGFVENIYAHLAVGDTVEVKVLSIGDDGKVGLSIKQASPDWQESAGSDRPRRSTIDKDFDRKLRKFMHGSQSIQGEVRRQRRARLGIKKR